MNIIFNKKFLKHQKGYVFSKITNRWDCSSFELGFVAPWTTVDDITWYALD